MYASLHRQEVKFQTCQLPRKWRYMTNLFAQDFYDNALNQQLTGYIVELITDKAFLYLWRWS